MAETRIEGNPRRKQEPASQPPDSQAQSIFFGLLPQEVRNIIYAHLFCSTRLAGGQRSNGFTRYTVIKPAPNSLAILHTCRRAKNEIGDTWIGQVLFSFEDPQTMLRRLSALPAGILPKMRHLRVQGDTIRFHFPDYDFFYPLSSTLRLLPGLRLDTLTVFGFWGPRISYGDLGGLIEESRGWKELHYITFNSDLLAFANGFDFSLNSGDGEAERRRYRREPQPERWQSILDDRDGASSRPSVAIYRSTIPDCPGSVINPKTRVRFEQKKPEGDAAQETYGLKEDAELMRDGERNKEMMIVVKRGTDVDYEEGKVTAYIDPRIGRFMPRMSFEQTRSELTSHISVFGDHGWDYLKDDEGHPTEVDAYEEADHYVWPPSYFLST